MNFSEISTIFTFLGVVLTGSPANATYNIYIYQKDTDVVASGSGTVNTTSFTPDDIGPASCGPGFFNPTNSSFCVGDGDSYYGITGPASFGPSSGLIPNTKSGSSFGLFTGALLVPTGYSSGGSFSGTATWNLQTIAGLGMTAGTYTWNWGTGASADTLVMHIGVSPPSLAPVSVPTLSEYALMALTSLMAMAAIWTMRKRRGQ